MATSINQRALWIVLLATSLHLSTALGAMARPFLGPYPGERFDYAETRSAEAQGITTGNVRADGVYEYRYVEVTDHGAEIANVISGDEVRSRPFRSSPRMLIRQSMNRWEAASGGTIRWVRCDLDTRDARYPNCSRDAQGRPAEVVIGIDPQRTSPLGCSLPWKFEHQERLAIFQGRRMAFNSATMINEFNVTHELGHCLGLIHEHQRLDRAHWLKFRTFEIDALGQGREPTNRSPVIGNYSYNTPMAYPGQGGNYRCGQVRQTGGLVGENCTLVGYAPPSAAWDDSTYMIAHVRDGAGRLLIPPEDGSKVKQLHARTHVSKDLNYFNTLAEKVRPRVDPSRQLHEKMLSPKLSDEADPAGSPALNTQSRGHYNGFSRGSDGNLYWRPYTAADGWARTWSPLIDSGKVASDPAATSWSADHSVVAFVNRRGAVRFRVSAANGDLTGTSGWRAVGGSFREARIPGSRIARAHQPAGSGRRTPSIKELYVGVGLVSRGDEFFDVVAVHANEHGHGELTLNTYDRQTWRGWTTLPVEPDMWSVVQRPSVIVNSRDNLLIAATVRNQNTGRCGIMEYEVEMPQRDTSLPPTATVSGTPTVVSYDFNGRVEIDCTTPVSIAPIQATRASGTPAGTIRFHDHHIFAINTKGHLLYRESGWAEPDYREIGGLPKSGTGVAVTNAPTRPNPASHDMLILMNGADLKQKYTFDANSGELRAPSVQAGGIWFRRWGNIH